MGASARGAPRAGYRGVVVDQRCYLPGARPTEVVYGPDKLIGDLLVGAGAGRPHFDLVGHEWGSTVRG